MSINDPITVRYNQRRQTWSLFRGRETFYNEDREMLEFPGMAQAEKYCNEVLGEPLGDRPDPPDPEPKQGWLL